MRDSALRRLLSSAFLCNTFCSNPVYAVGEMSFYNVFDISQQHIEYFNFRCKIQLDLPVK